jgi:chemotaxis signal transduction protein
MSTYDSAETGYNTGASSADSSYTQHTGDNVSQSVTGQEAHQFDLTCCCFSIADIEYHLRIEYMVEIADFTKVTVLPLAPEYVLGLANLRGEVMPVIDLASMKSIKRPPRNPVAYRLIVADAGGERVAFLAEGMPRLSSKSCGEEIDVISFVKNYKVRIG